MVKKSIIMGIACLGVVGAYAIAGGGEEKWADNKTRRIGLEVLYH